MKRLTPLHILVALICLFLLVNLFYTVVWPELYGRYLAWKSAPLVDRGAVVNVSRWWVIWGQASEKTTDEMVESWVPYLRQLGVASVDLQRTRVSNRVLSKLATLPLLRGLDLEDTSIDDEGLAALSQMKSLRYLDLTGTKVTDKGLMHLAAMARLECVRIARTNISRDAMLAFTHAHPAVQLCASDLPPPTHPGQDVELERR